MTLIASPPRMRPTVNVAAFWALISCATKSFRASMIAHAALTGLRARWGIAPWPPTPFTATRTVSELARNGPARVMNLPTGTVGKLCMPHTESTGNSSKRPSRIIASAPPAPSSAGWKMKWTVPSKPWRSTRWRAAPRSIVVCPSCPQPCIRPGCRDACSKVLSSSIARASMSARSPIARFPCPHLSVPTTPVPPRPRRIGMPHCVRRSATTSAVRCSS